MRPFPRILIAAILLFFPAFAHAQLASPSKFHLPGLGMSEAPTPEVGKNYDILIGTATIPINFARLVKRADGNYDVASQLSVGLGYLFVAGTMVPQSGDVVRIDPGFFIGPAGDIGVRQEENVLKGAFSLGAVIGFNSIAFTGGYDFLGKSPYLGVSGKFDFFMLKRDAFHEYSIREHR
jgi:hypothetical protein